MRFIVALAFGGSLVCVSPATSCSIVTNDPPGAPPSWPRTSIELIRRADVIVVAGARESVPASLPQLEPRCLTTLNPTGPIAFFLT
jgi:hypothetical protein